MKRTRLLSLAVPIGALLLGLGICEVGVRLYLRFSPKTFNGLARETGESFFFANRKPTDPLFPGKDRFDPLLGWHPAKENFAAGKKQTFNKMGWRSPHEYTPLKNPGTRRVILVGDSFTYGWQLDDSETLDRRLESLLGKKNEVWNFASGGYGLDQMAVIATRILPRFHPDVVFIGFIADDLERSCSRFAWGNSLKPYFELKNGKAELKGVPVPTPQDNLRRHEKTRLVDSLLAALTRLRIASVLTEPFFRRDLDHCLVHLNTAILTHIVENMPPDVRVHFVHLDGQLPTGFLERAARQGIKIHDLARGVRKLAQVEQKPFSRVDEYHPDANGIELYARLYQELLK